MALLNQDLSTNKENGTRVWIKTNKQTNRLTNKQTNKKQKQKNKTKKHKLEQICILYFLKLRHTVTFSDLTRWIDNMERSFPDI